MGHAFTGRSRPTGMVVQFPRPSAGRASGGAATAPPRLLDVVSAALRARHYSPRTEKAYIGWIRRFILFHGKRHPREMAEPEIGEFLSTLATRDKVAASTQNQALAALLFLYQEVLLRKLEWLGDLVHAKRPARVPVVLSRNEVGALLAKLDGAPYLVSALLYGAGMRLLEVLQLRVKDIDLGRREVTVRRGKGQRDRRTVLPGLLTGPLTEHLKAVRTQHGRDLAQGAGAVALPDALCRKYPAAAREWPWQWDSPRRGPTWIVRPDKSADTIPTRRSSSARCEPPPAQPASSSPQAPTPSATPSRHTCWNPATTSEQSKSSSVIATSARP